MVLYYTARAPNGGGDIIVYFDAEKYDFVKLMGMKRIIIPPSKHTLFSSF